MVIEQKYALLTTMERPKVIPENHKAVYDFYGDYYNPRAAKFGHKVMHLIYHPRVVWAPGAEEEVRDHLADDNGLGIMLGHSNIHDQFHAASCIDSQKTFRNVRGNAFIWAKSNLYQSFSLLRIAVDAMGAIPTHRRAEYMDEDNNISDEMNDLRRAVTAGLIDCTVKRINDGAVPAIFPEGTRNKGDVTKIQTIEKGPAIIAGSVAEERNLALVGIAMYYPRFRGLSLRNRIRPTLYVGNLLEGPFSSDSTGIADTQQRIHDSLQSSLDAAIEHTPARIYSR